MPRKETPGEPEVLDVRALAEWFFDLEVVLAGAGVIESEDEDADGAACLVDGGAHAAIVLIDVEVLGLGAGAEILAGEGVIGPGERGGGAEECGGEEREKEGLHGVLFLVRKIGGDRIWERRAYWYWMN